ncbi:MAG TPA: response regulator [Polyangiaceae bacterium]
MTEPPLRIVLVDDDPDALELVTLILEGAGMSVRAAPGASDAFSQIQSFSPHVIVSDIGMPEEDGYSLIRRVRSLASDVRSTPAIALTAFSGPENRERALNAGFDLHIVKPSDPDRLVSAIRSLVA